MQNFMMKTYKKEKFAIKNNSNIVPEIVNPQH